MNSQNNIWCLLILLSALTAGGQSYSNSENNRTINFPKESISVTQFPTKENLWVFVMAGQSNMAGRAFVEPKDTIANNRILTLDLDNNWVLAQAPLHRYQPNLMGLDCGISFAIELLKNIPDSVSIALIPTAMGGTSIQQWLDDETKKDIKLLTNLKQKTSYAMQFGTLKAVLWHQGEKDVKNNMIDDYPKYLSKFKMMLRSHFRQPNLPIVIGELVKNSLTKTDRTKREKFNTILSTSSKKDVFSRLVSFKGMSTFDGRHLDTKSVRRMGKRYAHAYQDLIREQKGQF